MPSCLFPVQKGFPLQLHTKHTGGGGGINSKAENAACAHEDKTVQVVHQQVTGTLSTQLVPF